MASPAGEHAVEDALSHGNALLKYISPNDVGITGSHQCGFYLPKAVWRMFTPHSPKKGSNSKHDVNIRWPDGRETKSCVTFYGKGTRDEYRLTRFGKDFPWLAKDSVGDLLVLIPVSVNQFIVHVLDSEDDIEQIQAALGVEVIESWGVYEGGTAKFLETPEECVARLFRTFAANNSVFPRTADFAKQTRDAIAACIKEFSSWSIDRKLMKWIDSEYTLFKMVERQICQSDIVRPFGSVDDFLKTAGSIMNRRKSRAGWSLENHFETILADQKIPFAIRQCIDGKIKPDILIPGVAEYENANYPKEKLCIMGLKTTCKDRWRQVLSEGKRVPKKHILTLQKGISVDQLNEMASNNITLVVPESLHKSYPPGSKMKLMTVQNFVDSVRGMIK